MTFERFWLKQEFGQPRTNEWSLEVEQSNELFRRSKAQQWIDLYRFDDYGTLNIESTARNVGIDVKFVDTANMKLDGLSVVTAGCIDFTYLSFMRGVRPVVKLNVESHRRSELRTTFGHELGHLFLESAAGVSPTLEHEATERFCDYFGEQMALPLSELEDIEEVSGANVEEIMSRYGVSHTTALRQLMRAGKLPRRFICDSKLGQTGNPLYAGKVQMGVICIDCAVGAEHEPIREDTVIDSYDFSDQYWAHAHEFCSCDLTLDRSIETHRQLNLHYGLWTDDDEQLMQTQKNDDTSRRKSIARRAVLRNNLGS